MNSIAKLSIDGVKNYYKLNWPSTRLHSRGKPETFAVVKSESTMRLRVIENEHVDRDQTVVDRQNYSRMT